MNAVLLLHGFATDCNDFSKFAPILSGYYDEIYCPNLPNHGVGTEKDKICHKKIISFVENAFDKLKSRHQNVDIIGFSMGGALATYLASIKDVNRLILLAPANKYLSFSFIKNSIKWFIDASHLEKCQKTGKEVYTDTTVTIKDMKYDVNEAVKLFFTQILKRYTLYNLKEFSKVIKHCNNNLKEINVPTLLIWGKLDQLVPITSIKYLLGFCRNEKTRFIEFPDVSHLMLYSTAHYKITDEILWFIYHTSPQRLTYNKT